MAAIVAVSNVAVGARSVSFKATSAGADTLAFSVVAAAFLAAGGKSTDAIYSFLTTSHTDAAGTLAALSAAGAIVDAISSAAAAVVTVGGDNSLSVAAAGDIAVRIALASSISA
jgi:hypothetical protein